ncbi:hypothetical protein Tco_0432353 [Tanacetum coccineum]|uniref:Uncharacterized protein n=1 Tax=Tanacetum coccineum TaxID=301880 RepID=A0ABQ4WWZ0_9ASTR
MALNRSRSMCVAMAEAEASQVVRNGYKSNGTEGVVDSLNGFRKWNLVYNKQLPTASQVQFRATCTLVKASKSKTMQEVIELRLNDERTSPMPMPERQAERKRKYDDLPQNNQNQQQKNMRQYTGQAYGWQANSDKSLTKGLSLYVPSVIAIMKQVLVHLGAVTHRVPSWPGL